MKNIVALADISKTKKVNFDFNDHFPMKNNNVTKIPVVDKIEINKDKFRAQTEINILPN